MTTSDAHIRHLSETTFDRNVVVIAGAGTGKTTLLVNRFIHTLMREPESCTMTEVVALTFTNKASTEMKTRIRERLTALIQPDISENRATPSGTVSHAELKERYGMSSERIAAKAEAGLHDLEKAQIGTLHSFAAHLLRLYPIESGVDPNFQEDDGSYFEDFFGSAWELWLEGELGNHGTNHDVWREMLALVELPEIRQLAFALSNELIPLGELRRQVQQVQLSGELEKWLQAKRSRATALLATYDRPKRRKVECSLGTAHDLFDQILMNGIPGSGSLAVEDQPILDQVLGKPPKDWSEENFLEAKELVRIAKKALSVDHALLGNLILVLTPFVERVRVSFLEEGWVRFDGLLARAGNLLRDYPAIRERLKQEYKAILVDEFQDTDPIQYETILYLAERPGCCSSTWRDIELMPGKLFIVGDPKQSIYAFRGADMEAFDQVVRKIRKSGGVVHELATNFRSHETVLNIVNACFEQLFHPKESIQPPHVPLMVRPNRQGSMQNPGVEMLLVREENREQEFDSAMATRQEAERLACWVKNDLLAREVMTDANGQSTPIRPGHIGILFRKLTQAQDYLEALHRQGLQFVTDGEKHFYRRQEVIDLINLLRVVENPHDAIAMVGLLRSPLGGLTDQEIYQLRERQAFNYQHHERLQGWESPKIDDVRRLYEVLATLNRRASARPLPEFLDLCFSHLPILELAAASLHGEQSVANLIKVREIAEALANRPDLTLTEFVDRMVDRVAEQPEEAEGALAEESLDAIRVLTIHKAKGLEFPIVILPGIHHGANLGHRDLPVSQDWATGVMGMSIGERCSFGALLTSEKFRLREEAEQRRVFYVGMTRAQERLILSGGVPHHSARGSFLDLLQKVASYTAGQGEYEEVQVGDRSFPQRILNKTDSIPQRRNTTVPQRKPQPEWTQFRRRWEQRERVWLAALASPDHLAPSHLLNQQGDKEISPARLFGGSSRGKIIGLLAHRILEQLDFAADFQMVHRQIETVCRLAIPPEGCKEAKEIADELTDLFQTFMNSAPYAQLQRATILGREVPFLMPWQSTSHSQTEQAIVSLPRTERKFVNAPQPLVRQTLVTEGRLPELDEGKDGLPKQEHTAMRHPTGMMEGVIDIVYQLDGKIWIADFKTDAFPALQLPKLIERYRQQCTLYREAVSRALRISNVGCQLLFLRTGKSVEI